MGIISDMFKLVGGTVSTVYNGTMGAVNTVTGNEVKGAQQLAKAASNVGALVGEVQRRVVATPANMQAVKSHVADAFQAAREARVEKKGEDK